MLDGRYVFVCRYVGMSISRQVGKYLGMLAYVCKRMCMYGLFMLVYRYVSRYACMNTDI